MKTTPQGRFHPLFVSLGLALALGASSVSAASSANDWQDEAKDAWIDGKAESMLMVNTNLNNFDINTDVEQGVVILTGKVDTELDKSLASGLVRQIDGVSEIKNELTVSQPASQSADLGQAVVDTKVSAALKTSLLLNPDISGTNIDVSVNDGVATLSGEVKSDAARDLAVLMAENAQDVERVIDELDVEGNA
ncbi:MULTISPECIES: BON domain-containing protein [Salinivibrio]|uniref:Transporter n=1 Tax=Salinivibrio siamensis TaxID=414286 RepID=A0ABX3KA08_9GAMM|nr:MULTISPECIES: BON domain-containing protein [Salinivibrio]KKA43578.1 transporter [Salinivibrio sp. KP-1]MPS30958.1 BON domain-containing protein [Salinivibrio sp. VYel7]MPX89501.1 BON domain-containing protein [Salinivibrio sp. VYel1]MPX92359.1 BON domain-containing protein [Salinivibrio sp. VYel9]MPX97065.1 BON domain-containing protein [Salinivibrio sp. VYel6]